MLIYESNRDLEERKTINLWVDEGYLAVRAEIGGKEYISKTVKQILDDEQRLGKEYEADRNVYMDSLIHAVAICSRELAPSASGFPGYGGLDKGMAIVLANTIGSTPDFSLSLRRYMDFEYLPFGLFVDEKQKEENVEISLDSINQLQFVVNRMESDVWKFTASCFEACRAAHMVEVTEYEMTT